MLVRNGTSENHIDGYKMCVTLRFTMSIAGDGKSMSKQMKWPKVTPKSVSKVAISGTSVIFMNGSTNKLNFL